MIYFFCFGTKNDFLSLFSRVSIKAHFPLKIPVIDYFQIFMEIICSSLSATYNNKKKELSSANSLALVVRSYLRSLMETKNNKGPRLESWGTPELFFFHVETYPMRTTHCLHCFLFFKKPYKRFSKFSNIPFWVSLKMIPSCHIIMFLIYQGSF